MEKKRADDLWVTCTPGLEGILMGELKALGFTAVAASAGGVMLRAGSGDIWKINLWSRVASRVLVRLGEFHASTFHELERRARKLDWARYLSAERQIRFRVTCRKSKLYHSDAVAERLLTAAAHGTGAVPAPDAEADDDTDDFADQLFVVRLANDVCTVSADTSGALLHRRGYRQAIAKAPLRETLASAMLLATDWDRVAPLVDPMCGSGTICIEAAMLARRLAPGARRRFSFERWPVHDSGSWKAMLEAAAGDALPAAPGPIVASDRDSGAVGATSSNAARAGVGGDIQVLQAAVSAAEYPPGPGWIVTNPPYGHRVGEMKPLRDLYAQLGNVVRERAPGYSLAALVAHRSLEAQLRLETSQRFRTTNGGIPVRLVVSGAA